MWSAPILKHNIVPLLIPHLSSFDYDGFLRISMCPYPLLLLFIVTTKVPFILPIMMSSMNGLNTSRSIVILSVIILSMVLSSCSRSSLKINLQISSPSHILKDAFVLWLTNDNLKLVSHPPWVWGGLLMCNRLWALKPPSLYLLILHTYLYYTFYLLYKDTFVYFIT